MDYVQLTYDRTLSVGLAGSNANANDTVDYSFIAVGNIPYGVVISSAGTSNPREARAGIGNTEATAGYAYGTGAVAPMDALKDVTDGSFIVDIDGEATTVAGLNFTELTSYEDVATVIGGKLSGKATVTFANGVFTFTSVAKGAESTVTGIRSAKEGTDVTAMIGCATYYGYAGTNAVTGKVLGVVIRNVVDEGGAGPDSNVTTVKNKDIGAYRQDGAIRVVAQDGAVEGGDVYFDSVTGELYATSAGTHTTKLGTAKWLTTVSAGEVGVIDITGLR